MSASLGALVLEIAARQIIPVLVTEVSHQAFRHAARSATESAIKRLEQPAAAPVPLHSVSTTTVISDMPGRTRLQVVGLRGSPARAAAIRERLAALPGVSHVEASPLTGRALVQYAPDLVTLPRILAATESPAPRPARRRARLASAPRLALVGN